MTSNSSVGIWLQFASTTIPDRQQFDELVCASCCAETLAVAFQQRDHVSHLATLSHNRICSRQCQVDQRPSLIVQVGVRTSYAKREERKEQRWETAKWLGLPVRNALVEAYRSPADPKEHKKTAHYQTWRDTVAEMMAEPRSSVKYENVFPDDEGWG
jgi:quinol monooxygenase YgiN